MRRRLVRPTGLLAEYQEALELVQVQADTIAALEALLTISKLHQPDDTGHACTCGTTWPCKTRRTLDGGQ